MDWYAVVRQTDGRTVIHHLPMVKVPLRCVVVVSGMSIRTAEYNYYKTFPIEIEYHGTLCSTK